jgi:hypothetical protein
METAGQWHSLLISFSLKLKENRFQSEILAVSFLLQQLRMMAYSYLSQV